MPENDITLLITPKILLIARKTTWEKVLEGNANETIIDTILSILTPQYLYLSGDDQGWLWGIIMMETVVYLCTLFGSAPMLLT